MTAAANGNEKIIDHPVMVNGRFVRNVGARPPLSYYHYLYMKDGDKDLMKRASLAIKVGSSIGAIVGIVHLSTFGRNPKFASQLEPIYKVAYATGGGIMAALLHAGSVSFSSLMLGGRDLVFNWAVGGGVSGALVYSIVRKTPSRMGYLGSVPVGFAIVSGLIKVAVIYDKPIEAPATTTYGVQATQRNMGPRYFDTINPYRRQEEHYLEKYL